MAIERTNFSHGTNAQERDKFSQLAYRKNFHYGVSTGEQTAKLWEWIPGMEKGTTKVKPIHEISFSFWYYLSLLICLSSLHSSSILFWCDWTECWIKINVL